MRLLSRSKFLLLVAVFFIFLPERSRAAFYPADLDQSGCVSAGDITLFQNAFGASSGQADLVANGKVDVRDFAALMHDYGKCDPQASPSLESQSPFGIEYGRGFRNTPFTPTPLSSFWKTTGAKWVKLNDVQWGKIEPNAPVSGVHTYSWDQLDHDISKENGLATNDRPNWDQDFNIVVEIRALNTWAQKPYVTPPIIGTPGRPPKDENLADYRAWVKAVVERYDDDGVNDAPDLTRPVSVYEIESEGSGDPNNLFYTATPQEYVLQLQTAYQAAKEADPNVKIMLNGLNLRDLFADGSTEAQLEARLATLNYQDSVFNVQPLLDAKDWLDQVFQLGKGYFDIIENHELGTWRQMSGNAAWIESELVKQGINPNTVQIWAGDAISASALIYLSGLEINPPFGQPLSVAGVADNAFSKNLKLLSIMGANNNVYYDLQCVMGVLAASSATCKPNDATYQAHITQDKAAYDAWFRRLQAEEVVKKYVYGLESGYNMVNMGTLENWLSISGFPEEGFLDPNPNNPFLNGTPRPIFYAYQLMTQKMGDISMLSRLDVGNANIFAYEITRANNAKVYVVWYDDGVNEFPTQAQPVAANPSVNFQLSLPGTLAHVTPTITARGVTTSTTTDVAITGGKASLTISKTPLFIEVQ